MPQIRRPIEFAMEAQNTRLAPQIDMGAVDRAFSANANAFQTVNDIVTHATEVAHRANATADATRLESELARVSRETAAEPPPEGADMEAWIKGTPDRYRQRAQEVRASIQRTRGFRAANTYQGFFNPEADVIQAKYQLDNEERSQARAVDWSRGSSLELAATLREQALNPDLPETRPGDDQTGTRADAHRRALEVYHGMVRDGLITRTQEADLINNLEAARNDFRRGEGEIADARRRAADIRQQTSDPEAQLRIAREDEDLGRQERTVANLLQMQQQDAAAFAASSSHAMQVASAAVERDPANWLSSLPADTRRILERDHGSMDGLRATAANILANGHSGTGGGSGGGASAAQSRAANSPVYRATLMRLLENPAARDYMANNLQYGSPLAPEDAALLNRYIGTNMFSPGDTIATMMSADDWKDVLDTVTGMRTGEMPNATGNQPLTFVGSQVDRISRLAQEQGFLTGGNTQRDRRTRVWFEGYVRSAVEDAFRNGGPRPLSLAEMEFYAAAAARASSAIPDPRDHSGEIEIGAVPRSMLNRAITELENGHGAASSTYHRELSADARRNNFNVNDPASVQNPAFMSDTRRRLIRERLRAIETGYHH
jgi:hypothetical protein